jgi:hypothetical protein
MILQQKNDAKKESDKEDAKKNMEEWRVKMKL